MEISQIQLSYIELEDRMVMRINVEHDRHVALILTRRICRFMVENINLFLGVKELNLSSEILDSTQPANLNENNGMSRVDKPAGGMTPLEERNTEGNILSRTQDLIHNAACELATEDLKFTFFLQSGQSIGLNMPRSLATGVHQLLSSLLVKSQWFSGLTTTDSVTEKQALDNPGINDSTVTYH